MLKRTVSLLFFLICSCAQAEESPIKNYFENSIQESGYCLNSAKEAGIFLSSRSDEKDIEDDSISSCGFPISSSEHDFIALLPFASLKEPYGQANRHGHV